MCVRGRYNKIIIGRILTRKKHFRSFLSLFLTRLANNRIKWMSQITTSKRAIPSSSWLTLALFWILSTYPPPLPPTNPKTTAMEEAHLEMILNFLGSLDHNREFSAKRCENSTVL